MSGVSENDIFLGRQPIANRRRELVAYELLFRSGRTNHAMVIDDVFATATVIKNAFSGLGIDTALGTKKGFINFDERLLVSDVVEALPKDRVVLEILEHVSMTPRVIDRCRALREAGYEIALDDVSILTEALKAVVPHVSFVKVDISVMTEAEVVAIVAELRAYDVTLLAEKIETAEQFDFCLATGFHLFQGHFLARPTIIAGRSVQPSTLVLLKVSRLIAVDAEIEELEKALRQAPDLTVRLLRIANLVRMDRPNKIFSLRNAVIVLGRVHIGRIVQLMLFAQQWDADLNTDPLVQTAAVRGALMEEIADSLGLSKLRDRSFLVGILSLAHSLFGQPLVEIVELLNLDTVVQEALLDRSGPLGKLLNLVEASENADSRAFISVARELGLNSTEDFNRWQVEAMRWAGSL